jgi:putative flippase GtrA
MRFLRQLAEKVLGYTWLRYVLVGGMSFFINFAIFYLCHKQLGWWYVYATIVAGSVAWMVNFPLHKFWTFEDYRKKAARTQVPAHLTLKLFNTYAWDPLLLYTLVEGVGVPPLWGKVFVGSLLGAQNYVLCRYVIFRRPA